MLLVLSVLFLSAAHLSIQPNLFKGSFWEMLPPAAITATRRHTCSIVPPGFACVCRSSSIKHHPTVPS